MTTPAKEFQVLHRQMKACIARDNPPPEIKVPAERVVLGLWMCANNRPPLGVLLVGLVEDIDVLECALRRGGK